MRFIISILKKKRNLKMFICSCKKSYASKKDYLKHLRNRLLVNVDHKYPLYCHQPGCNNKKDMDSINTSFIDTFCFTKNMVKSYQV